MDRPGKCCLLKELQPEIQAPLFSQRLRACREQGNPIRKGSCEWEQSGGLNEAISEEEQESTTKSDGGDSLEEATHLQECFQHPGEVRSGG